ncbi:DUF4349 domain-containing protein [Brucepastera parasyntrophica]|uniref:DUF4349 domain-containing protein n=1 Tax=Brucepastera parasyntrophica TaxID=2880008 RepID=UPI00210B7BA5|nr:DUF4349 domain-containing protein [Brucepastera parasyntrophica]ULQ60864.1 DUF4349 domain-containing protein [Brucepastera parasyntrophica]
MRKIMAAAFPAAVLAVLFISCSSGKQMSAASEARAYGYDSETEASYAEEQPERMIAYTAYYVLDVKDSEEVRTQLVKQAQELRGFVVRDSTDYVSVRIPASSFNTFIEAVKRAER